MLPAPQSFSGAFGPIRPIDHLAIGQSDKSGQSEINSNRLAFARRGFRNFDVKDGEPLAALPSRESRTSVRSEALCATCT